MNTKKELYKLLINSIGFVIILFTVLFIIEKTLAYFVSFSDKDQTGKINLIMQHKIDPEILILGSSVAEVGFNSNLLSEKLKKTVYNAAIDGTTIAQSQFILDEFFTYSQNCEHIIIGLAFFSFGEKNNMTEPSRYLAHFSNPHVKNNIKKISPQLYYKLRYMPFYSFTQTKHTYYKNAIEGLINLLKKKQLKPDVSNGFVAHDIFWNGEKVTKDQFGSTELFISENSVNDYINIINNIKTKHIEPVIVITPMYINGQKKFKNYNSLIKAAEKIALKTNSVLFDFSKSNIVKTERYFYNNGHLNINGAEEFSVQVADSLKTLKPK